MAVTLSEHITQEGCLIFVVDGDAVAMGYVESCPSVPFFRPTNYSVWIRHGRFSNLAYLDKDRISWQDIQKSVGGGPFSAVAFVVTPDPEMTDEQMQAFCWSFRLQAQVAKGESG